MWQYNMGTLMVYITNLATDCSLKRLNDMQNMNYYTNTYTEFHSYIRIALACSYNKDKQQRVVK